MWSRRQFLARSAGGLAVLAGGALQAQNRGQEAAAPENRDNRNLMTDEAQQAINRGLSYLARYQAPNGAWGTNRARGDIAVSSLAALAFMAGGHQPGRGQYQRHVSLAAQYIVERETGAYQTMHGRVATPGFLWSSQSLAPHGPMYGHGFGTLFLAEVHGMVQDRNLRDRLRGTLQRAVQLIIRSQNFEGGWRYEPVPREADISVTICQIMALRAARNAGIYVPRSVVERCIEYVKQCQDLRHDAGGFRYIRQGGPTGFARTAAGVVALNSAGIYDGPEVDAGLNYLRDNCFPGQANNRQFGFLSELETHFYYGHYYAVQAMWIRGGRYWREWFPAIRNELVFGRQLDNPNARENPHHRQRADGSWFDGRFCPHYCTAMACIILQVANNYLPIFQPST
jgi:hypothetical protein